jgi:hypothetical protein
LQVGSAFWLWKAACGDPHVYPGKIAGNVRLASCPANRELGTATDITRLLRRPYVRSLPGRNARVTVEGDTLALSGSYAADHAADSDPRACDLEIWVPGEPEPRASMTGVQAAKFTRVEPGSTALGPSGGWLMSGCVDGAYRILLN